MPADFFYNLVRRQEMPLHCPRCATPLTRTSTGKLECAIGGMDLSDSLERRLIETYDKHLRNSSEEPLGFEVGGKWYCPDCSVATTESVPGIVRCPECKRSLSEFIFDLVELHPHVPPNKSLERA